MSLEIVCVILNLYFLSHFIIIMNNLRTQTLQLDGWGWGEELSSLHVGHEIKDALGDFERMRYA